MIPEKRLITSFNQFISRFPYDTWATVTYAKGATVKPARSRFLKFLKYLNKDEEFYKKYIRLWLFLEKSHRNSKSVHVHSLIDGIIPEMVPKLHRKCNDYFGESKIISGHKGVIPYVAEKYTSPLLIDFDYCKINSRYRNDRRLP